MEKITGFSYFKEAFHRLDSLSDRMMELSKSGNYNLVLVNDCGANEFMFSDMLYALLVSKGVIKDQRIVRGDLDDAVRTSANTSLFYFIMENWNFGDREGFRWGMPQEESFRLLSRRKNVYITTMDRVQYEKAKELDYFKAFFPHTVEIKDLREEEKVELLKCAAKEYGFAFDAKSFRNSDILKLPYDYGHEAINTLVKRLEDSRRDFVCIMAGYTNEMNQMLSSNPGLRDRIQFYIDFPDYSAEELVQIYCKYAESEAYQLGADAKVTLRQMAEQIIRNKDENFSNARLIRKVFERTRMKQAMRTSDNMISAEDIQAVFAESDMRALLDSVQVQRRIGFAG